MGMSSLFLELRRWVDYLLFLNLGDLTSLEKSSSVEIKNAQPLALKKYIVFAKYAWGFSTSSNHNFYKIPSTNKLFHMSHQNHFF